MTHTCPESTGARWARFRFSVIGSLLSSPAARGALQGAIRSLAEKTWSHPVTGRDVHFSAVTIARWYYTARRQRDDPVTALRRAVRKDRGAISLAAGLVERLHRQYGDHPDWSYQLHHDNLAALVKADPSLGRLPSYSTVKRAMQAYGWVRRPRLRPSARPGEARAENRRQAREIRSYEATHVGALWHLDFHHGSLKVLTPGGQWQRPIVLGILDDHSRLCCHMQWYLSETAEDLVHGLSQAIQKRGLPRALLTDNGSAMVAEEVTEGLLRLGIVHERTLPYSPYQNGKQESFWGTLEGRLLKMLDGVAELTLEFLNKATQAWVEVEYNRAVHRETGCSPVRALRAGVRCAPVEPLQRIAARYLSPGNQQEPAPERRHDLAGDRAVRDSGTVPSLPGRLRTLCPVGPGPSRSGRRPERNDSGSPLSPRQDRQRRRPPGPDRARQYRRAAGTAAAHRWRAAAPLETHPPGVLGHRHAAGLFAQDPPGRERRRIMNGKKLLALYGLKWNPFSPELPSEGLLATPRIENFAWRVEQLVQEGGFALITGESGTGKSVALRMVAARLSAVRDVMVGVIERPQSKGPDFYRELGDIFAVKLTPHNRWCGFKALRERWKTHLASSRIRPVLLIDEAQEMSPDVLGELRILSSADFDATSLLTVILSGDGRLLELLRQEALVPLGTRIRTRLVTESATRDELLELLQHALAKAGNASLMTAELMETLVDHSAGNYRLLMIMGGELLAYGMAHEVAQLDEKCYLEVYQPRNTRPAPKKKARV